MCSNFDRNQVYELEVFAYQILSKEETTESVLRTFAWKPRPEYGVDCLVCAISSRQQC
jgi:hypothetical protein